MTKTSMTIAVCASLLSAGAALADTPFQTGGEITSSPLPPDAFRDIVEITPAGKVLGADAWTDGSSVMTWIKDPQSGGYLAAFVFDKDGVIVHPNAPKDSGLRLENLINDTFGLNRVEIPERFTPDIENILEGMDEQSRNDAVLGLIDALKGVEGQDAFDAAILNWIAEARSSGDTAPAPAAPEAEVEPEPAAEPAQTQEAAPVAPAEAAPEAAEEAAAPEEPEQAAQAAEAPPFTIWDAEPVEGASILQALQASDAQLSFGEQGKPVVWLVTDPTCIACLPAWTNISSLVKSGDIEAKVVMLPVMNEDSPASVAGVMLSEDPAQVLDDMAGGAEAPIARYSSLGDEKVVAIKRAMDAVVAHAVPTLPLTLIETDAGFTAYLGQMDLAALEAAIKTP